MKQKYVTYRKGAWRLDKRHNGKRITASFQKLEDALNIRDIYIEHDWNLTLTTPQLFFHNNTYYILYKPDKHLKILLKTDSKTEADKFLETYKDTDYIHKVGNKYHIQKTICDDYVWFGSYNTLEEAIKYRNLIRQHNWNKDYFEEIYKQSETVQNRYIYKSRGKYKITRTKGDVQITYGSYDTIEEARNKRDELISNNWKQGTNRFLLKLFGRWWVKKDTRKNGISYMNFYGYAEDKELVVRARDYYLEHGFPEKPLFSTDALRYIRKHDGGYYIEKQDGGKETFPAGKSLADAIALRDILVANNWNPPLREYKHNGRTYILYLKNDKYVIELLKDIKTTKHIYMNKRNNNYIIKHNEFWGTYKTSTEARKMRDTLINYNWNRELYNNIYKGKTDIHIHKTRKLYRLNYKQFSAYYEHIDHARIVRDYLDRHDWKIPYQQCITQTDGGYTVELDMLPYYYYRRTYSSLQVAKQQLREYVLHGVDDHARMKYVRKNKGYYYVVVYDHATKKDIRYSKGTKSVEEAILMRDILVDNSYVVPSGDYCFDNQHYMTYNVDGKLSLRDPRKPAKRRGGKHYNTENMHIRRAGNGKYEIVKHVDGKLHYFGRYDTLDEAIVVRDDLIDHYWDLEYYNGFKVDKRSSIN